VRFAPDHRGERVLDIDITPMIDVVFLLIIFFMTTAQFVRMTKADVDLPIEKGDEEQVSSETGLIVNVTQDGRFIVDQRTVDLPLLARMVAAERRRVEQGGGSLDLWIRADRNAPASVLNRLSSELAEIGVRGWRLATEAPRGGQS